jgi:hypothetical protein
LIEPAHPEKVFEDVPREDGRVHVRGGLEVRAGDHVLERAVQVLLEREAVSREEEEAITAVRRGAPQLPDRRPEGGARRRLRLGVALGRREVERDLRVGELPILDEPVAERERVLHGARNVTVLEQASLEPGILRDPNDDRLDHGFRPIARLGL